MNDQLSSTERSLIWLSSDPLISNPSYTLAVLNVLSNSPNREPAILLTGADKSRQLRFNKFIADKITPNLTIYELNQKDNFTWLSTVFPLPPIAVVMIICDPRKWFLTEAESLTGLAEGEIKDNISKLMSSQKRYVRSCFNSILAYSDLPPIVLYLRDAEEPLPLEQLIGADMLPNMNILSYHIEKLSLLPGEFSQLLKTL